MLESTTQPGLIAGQGTNKRWPLLLAASLLFIAYATLSIRRHQLGLTSGYDLGIYEQAVRHLAHFEAPRTLVDNEVFPRLIVVLIAPFYRAFPAPETLLVAQAFLMAIGVIPLMAWARRSLGPYGGIVVALIYGLAPGIATAIGFDFHEVAFAVPLVAWSVSALGQGHVRHAIYWSLPLVLVKEDLGLTVVAAIGVYAFFYGERRLGVLTTVFGVLCTALSTFVLIPAMSGGYFLSGTFPRTIQELFDVGFSGLGYKAVTIVALLGPTAVYLALKSPLILLIIPTLGARFVTSNENFWIPSFHYDAVLVPIVTAAFIHGFRRTSDSLDRRVSLSAALIATVLLTGLFDFKQLAQPSFWTTNQHAQAMHRLAALIPDNAKAAASNDVIAQLTSRTDVVWFGDGCDCGPGMRPGRWRSANWIIVDTTIHGEFKGGNAAAFDALLSNGFSLVAEADGLRLARRDVSS